MEQEMLSLYDYLGHASGPELGKQVAEYGRLRKTPYKIRYISNPKYQGDVHLYNREFLDEFFAAKKTFEDTTDYTEINTMLSQDSFNNNKELFD